MDAETAEMNGKGNTSPEDIKRGKPRLKEQSKKSSVREWGEAIIIALILAVIIRTFIVQAFKIPSGSMLETLQIGDHILVNKFIYRFTDVERKDIVVFKYPLDEKRDFIKRVIALPGETFELRDREVFINGEKINESYTRHEEIVGGFVHPRDNYGPITVPKGKVFVMGDNRENSADSRFWGFLDVEKIRGKAFAIYWSWNNDEFSVRWSRLGNILE